MRGSWALVVALVAWRWAGARAGLLGGLAELVLPAAAAEGLGGLLSAASATCEVLPLERLFSRKFTLELPHTELIAFTRAARTAYRVPHVGRMIHAHQLHKRPLVLYIPGWWNTPTDESTHTVIQALLTKNKMILVLDTRLSFCRGYVDAASRVTALARLLYELLEQLADRGVPPTNVHLIGFSLGAHVAGITGKLVRRKMKSQLLMITALDPAKPCFGRSAAYRLDRRDAGFVQVIHTSAGALGLEQPVGHADVYMNGVSGKQPECRDRKISLECDHAQAWRLYSASVTDERHMMAHRCDSWEDLKRGRCHGNATVLGYGCDSGTRGLFLFRSAARRAGGAAGAQRRRAAGLFDWLF